jgi:hypothetical protein
MENVGLLPKPSPIHKLQLKPENARNSQMSLIKNEEYQL